MLWNDNEFGGEEQGKLIKREGKALTLSVSESTGTAIDHNCRREEGTPWRGPAMCGEGEELSYC